MNKVDKENPPRKRSNRMFAVLLGVSNFFKRIVRFLPFWRHPHYVPFLLLCHPRSGSTRVNNALNIHPRILSVGEELRGCFSRAGGEEALSRFFKTPQSRLVQALGFKFYYEDAYTPAGISFWKHWRAKQRKVVHLQRKNLLRLVVLDEIARQNQQLNGADVGQVAQEVRAVEIYPEILLQRMAHFENLQEVFRNQLKGYPALLFIWYEDLVHKPDEAYYKIQEFLGVAPKAISSLFNSQDPEPLQNLLLNYKEVEVMLRGTQWSDFLD